MTDDRVYLGHMRDAISKIREYTTAGKQHFLADAMTRDAVRQETRRQDQDLIALNTGTGEMQDLNRG